MEFGSQFAGDKWGCGYVNQRATWAWQGIRYAKQHNRQLGLIFWPLLELHGKEGTRELLKVTVLSFDCRKGYVILNPRFFN